MKKSRDLESSLELLLDTMCNTFGGVMFIAIALTVVLSMAAQIPSDVQEEQNLEKMQEKLTRLSAELKEKQKKIVEQENLLALLKNDPRREMLKDILVLEQKIPAERVRHDIIQAKVSALEKETSSLSRRRLALETEVAAQQLSSQKYAMEFEKLKNKMQNVKNERSRIQPSHISFKVALPVKKQPYFFIVYNSRIWKVGPDRVGNEYIPNRDVDFVEKGNSVICRISSSAPGVPLLSGQTISPEARALLKNVPADRTLNFSIHANSLKDFCIFREILKKENIPHGIDTVYNRFNQFIYGFSSHAENRVY